MIGAILASIQPEMSIISGLALTWNDVFGVLGWIFIGSGIIEWIPSIKINPWTWLFGKIGKMLNQSVEQEIASIKEDLSALTQKVTTLEETETKITNEIERREAINARRRILIFADDIRKGETRFSEERYDEILYDMKIYNQYCKKYPTFPNDKTILSQQIIKEKYKEYLENNLFI